MILGNARDKEEVQIILSDASCGHVPLKNQLYRLHIGFLTSERPCSGTAEAAKINRYLCST